MKDEQTKLEEKLLHELPNPFKWSNYKQHLHKRMIDYIMKDPYGCDNCGDTYNKGDLHKMKKQRICKNCLCTDWDHGGEW